MTLIARVGAAIGSADAETQAVLRDALAALVEDHGLLATLERRRAIDRKRKRPTAEHASGYLNSTESELVTEFRAGCSLPPQVSLLSPEPPNNPSFPPLSHQGQRDGTREYPPAFAAVWERYPRRAGGNSKREAYRAWSARLAQGITAEELAAGVERYRAFIAATGRESTEYVLQTATFFGPNERWREVWIPPVIAPRNGARPQQPPLPDDADAAWERVVAMVPAWQRREVTAEIQNGLPEPIRRGLSKIGGFRVLSETPDAKRVWLQREFTTAYHATPAAPNGAHAHV